MMSYRWMYNLGAKYRKEVTDNNIYRGNLDVIKESLYISELITYL